MSRHRPYKSRRSSKEHLHSHQYLWWTHTQERVVLDWQSGHIDSCRALNSTYISSGAMSVTSLSSFSLSIFLSQSLSFSLTLYHTLSPLLFPKSQVGIVKIGLAIPAEKWSSQNWTGMLQPTMTTNTMTTTNSDSRKILTGFTVQSGKTCRAGALKSGRAVGTRSTVHTWHFGTAIDI